MTKSIFIEGKEKREEKRGRMIKERQGKGKRNKKRKEERVL